LLVICEAIFLVPGTGSATAPENTFFFHLMIRIGKLVSDTSGV
jgi:hypothetical protein